MTNLFEGYFRTFPGKSGLALKQICHLDRGVMGLRPTQGDEKRLVPATSLYGIVTLALSSRPERSGAEGPAVPRTLRGDVFRPERSGVERPAVSFLCSHADSLDGPYWPFPGGSQVSKAKPGAPPWGAQEH